MLSLDLFVEKINSMGRIKCESIEERNECLVLLDDLGFNIFYLEELLNCDHPEFLNVGIDYRNTDMITCYTSMHSLKGDVIEYKDVPFDEYKKRQEDDDANFQKEFLSLIS